MSKAVMISIRPKWCEKICRGEKSIEVRKTRPNLETRSPGGSYSVKGEGQPTTNDVARQSCLTLKDMHEYLQAKAGYGWHISNLKIYDPLKKLSEFSPVCMYKNDDKSCQSRMIACSYQKYDYNPDGSINLDECGRTLERPPQSWCYVEEVE